MTINKITICVLALVTLLFAWFIGANDDGQNSLAIEAIVKIANQIFRGLLVLGFSLAIMYTFQQNGNGQAEKISKSPLSLSILFGFLFLAIAVAIAG